MAQFQIANRSHFRDMIVRNGYLLPNESYADVAYLDGVVQDTDAPPYIKKSKSGRVHAHLQKLRSTTRAKRSPSDKCLLPTWRLYKKVSRYEISFDLLIALATALIIGFPQALHASA